MALRDIGQTLHILEDQRAQLLYCKGRVDPKSHKFNEIVDAIQAVTGQIDQLLLLPPTTNEIARVVNTPMESIDISPIDMPLYVPPVDKPGVEEKVVEEKVVEEEQVDEEKQKSLDAQRRQKEVNQLYLLYFRSNKSIGEFLNENTINDPEVRARFVQKAHEDPNAGDLKETMTTLKNDTLEKLRSSPQDGTSARDKVLRFLQSNPLLTRVKRNADQKALVDGILKEFEKGSL